MTSPALSREQPPYRMPEIGPDPAHPDYELLVAMFKGGPITRQAALETADLYREHARKK